jgi:hypothetical protein
MAKIEIKPIEEGISIASSAMQKKGIVSEIKIAEVPEDDSEKEGEFVEIIRMEGRISSGQLKTKFDFYLPIPVATHRNPKDWAWIIVSHFLGEALCILRERVGWTDEVKSFLETERDLVDELIKA